MDTDLGRVLSVAERQRGLIAVWQMRRLRVSAEQIKIVTGRLRRVYRGVYARDDLDELGWLHAAVLALGPGAAISHGSALVLLGLRDDAPSEIHVSVPRGGGRAAREGIAVHRSRHLQRRRAFGIPVTSPTQSIRDANLPPHELYRALERAEDLGYHLTLPPSRALELRRTVKGRTRSDAEARFILLCREHGIELPLVNHRVNGIEADFHWPDAELVVEVDGYEFHKERPQFEEDRRRELVHAGAGYIVLRASAKQVQHDPELVAAAVRRACARTAPAPQGRRSAGAAGRTYSSQ